MKEVQEIAELAQDLARRAGKCVAELRASSSVEQMTKDGGRELVTSADLASHALIQEETSRRTPAAQYLSEEGDTDLASFDFRRPTWVVDPLDGTVNYVYGQRHVGISLAYMVDGEVQVGVVHGPFYGETFVAVRGRGAMLDGRELPRRPAVPLASALISTGFPHRRDGMDAILDRFERVARRCRDVRRLACPALDICWVACGRLDAAYETLRPWDVAAAGLVAREVGVDKSHYAAPTEDIPREIQGQDVVYAREGLLAELIPVLRGDIP